MKKWFMTLPQTTCLRWPNNLKEMVPEKYGKDKLEKIIKEEMGHIKILSKELVALKNQ
ncbi:MAG: hypothetical protein WBC36_03480 [Desulfobacterales bacterium]